MKHPDNSSLPSDLTIGYDAKRALFNTTGLGNYSRFVVELMASRNPGWSIDLFSPKLRHISPRALRLIEMPNVRLVGPEGIGRLFPSLWRSVVGMGRQVGMKRVALFHGLSGELPPDIDTRRVPAVVTIHDLIFHRCPENYTAIDRRIYDRKFRSAVKRATRVIAISETTKRDIIEFYSADPAKIDVIYQGCDAQFSRPVAVEDVKRVKTLYNIPERYIIAVGTVEQRKNQHLAIQALSYLPSDVALVVVGGEHGAYQAILDRIATDAGVGARVIRLRGVPFADLPPLYNGALFSSYTSRYEGFGLPLIESLLCGTPAVAATGSCLEEAAGPGAIYVGPDDVRGYVEAAQRLIADSGLRERLAAEGARHASEFSDDHFASALENTYMRALNRC